MVRQYHQLNGHEFEQSLADSRGQRSLACCSPFGLKESGVTQQLNNNKFLCQSYIVWILGFDSKCYLHLPAYSSRICIMNHYHSHPSKSASQIHLRSVDFLHRTFSSLVHITIITAFVHCASYLSCLPVLNMCSFPLYLGNNLKTFSRSTRFLMSWPCLPLHSWLVPVSLSSSCFGHIPCQATHSPSQDWPVPTYSFSLKLSLMWQYQTDLSV